MKIGLKFFIQSFKTTLVRPAAWIISLAFVLLDVIFVYLIPVMVKLDSPWMAPFITQFFWLFTIGMFCSFLGELVANPEDRLFVLTRPVKRTTYFTVKLLLAVIACCLLASLNSICVHFANEHFKADPQFVSVSLVEDTKQALTSFMIAIFGGVVGCSFRYYARPMIPTVFVMVFTLSYAVSFAFLKGTTSNETNMSDLEFFTMPLALMLPLSVVVINIGYLLNSKVNIGV